MLKVEHTEVLGWEHAIRGMRNPLNSWDKSDSYVCGADCCECKHVENGTEMVTCHDGKDGYCIGENDYDLMKRLVKAGTDHSKFMRMITVYCDITSSLYFFKEFDTYKVGSVANSCSTMHKIHAKEFTLDDFSCEHLLDDEFILSDIKDVSGEYTVFEEPLEHLKYTIEMLNACRYYYNVTKHKTWWYQMIQLLPSSYNQKRTVQLNYAVLRAMYHARVTHKLDEWHTFCEWIESLPYSELITME